MVTQDAAKEKEKEGDGDGLPAVVSATRSPVPSTQDEKAKAFSAMTSNSSANVAGEAAAEAGDAAVPFEGVPATAYGDNSENGENSDGGLRASLGGNSVEADGIEAVGGGLRANETVASIGSNMSRGQMQGTAHVASGSGGTVKE